MTEIEAINTLQYLLGYENAVDNGELDTPNNLNSQEKEALRMILEEIQQYRAIGTVEELTALKENCIEPSSLRLYLTQLEKYHAIGTIEEFKALKEKNEPKKPIGEYTQCKCSVCGRRVRSGRGSSSFVRDNFCQRCGQKLDWQ